MEIKINMFYRINIILFKHSFNFIFKTIVKNHNLYFSFFSMKQNIFVGKKVC